MKKLMLMTALLVSGAGIQASETCAVDPCVVIVNAAVTAMMPIAAVKVDEWLSGHNPNNSFDQVCRGLVAAGSLVTATGSLFADSKNSEFAKTSRNAASLGALITFTTMITHATVRTVRPAA